MDLRKDSISVEDLQDQSMKGSGDKRPSCVPSSICKKKSRTDSKTDSKDKRYHDKKKAELDELKAKTEKQKENIWFQEGQIEQLRKDQKESKEEIIGLREVLGSLRVQIKNQNDRVTELEMKIASGEDLEKEMDDLKAKHAQEKAELESKIYALELELKLIASGEDLKKEMNDLRAKHAHEKLGLERKIDASKREPKIASGDDLKKEMDDLKAKHAQEEAELENKIYALELELLMLGLKREINESIAQDDYLLEHVDFSAQNS